MSLTAHFTPLHEIQADWLIVPVWEGEALAGASARLDVALDGLLGRLQQAGDIAGKVNELTTLLAVRGAKGRLLVVGLGARAGADRMRLTDAAAAAARLISGKKVGRLAFALPEPFANLAWNDVAQAAGVGLLHGCGGPGIRKKEPDRFLPEELWLVASPEAPAEPVRAGARRAEIEGLAVALARELVNLPPCDLYPETFAQRAREVAAPGVECIVFDERQIEAERMGALLGVARGSERPPRLVVLRYRAGTTGKTLALIGKGVTFDSGGLSLKTNEQMLDMKCDMAGAAAVLAGITAAARLELPVNLLGVLALVENMPSGKALKLGDVIHARNGKSIEVLNTDAEGRLILADALTYAVDQKADHLVDLATLTGSCMIALGTDVAGLMSNREDWSAQVQKAAKGAGERVWPLPMDAHFGELIKSHVADVKNVAATRYGGAITAAKFLEQFVGETPWAHLDIAGPAWAESENVVRDAGGTGFGVRTLVELARMYGESGQPITSSASRTA